MLLKEVLPEFYNEVKLRLNSLNREDLTSQLESLYLTERCKCEESDCSSFNVSRGNSPLTSEEQRNKGAFLKHSFDIDAEEGWIAIDIDHLERIVGFEILNRDDIHKNLERIFTA